MDDRLKILIKCSNNKHMASSNVFYSSSLGPASAEFLVKSRSRTKVCYLSMFLTPKATPCQISKIESFTKIVNA